MDYPIVAYMQSPIGRVEIKADDNYIQSILLISGTNDDEQSSFNQNRVIKQCIEELSEYFAGVRTKFTIPIKQTGTDFQQQVWLQLLKIPYGTTISYGELAKHLGDIKRTRAVGAANGKNKLWIVVPCHRVIGANGSLTGYAGGIDCKRWLLQHEANFAKHKEGKLF